MPSSTRDIFTLLVYLHAAACISEEINFGTCWRRDILTFKGQRWSTNHKKITNQYAIIEWPLFDAPTSTYGVFTSLCLSLLSAVSAIIRAVKLEKNQPLLSYVNLRNKHATRTLVSLVLPQEGICTVGSHRLIM